MNHVLELKKNLCMHIRCPIIAKFGIAYYYCAIISYTSSVTIARWSTKLHIIIFNLLYISPIYMNVLNCFSLKFFQAIQALHVNGTI